MALSQEAVGRSNYNGTRKISYRRMPERTRMVELHSKYLFIAHQDKKKN